MNLQKIINLIHRRLQHEIKHHFDQLHQANERLHRFKCKPGLLDTEFYQQLIEIVDVEDILEETSSKIEEWEALLTQSPEQKISIVILKAYLLYFGVIFENDFDQKIVKLKLILKMCKKYAQFSSGVWIYTSALKYLHVAYNHIGNKHKAMKKLKLAHANIVAYLENCSQPYYLSYRQLLGDPPSKIHHLDGLVCKIAFGFWKHYVETNNVEGQLFVAVPSARLIAGTLHLGILNILNYMELVNIISLLFEARKIKQAAHILAGTMFHFKKMYNALDIDDKLRVDFIYADLLQLFSKWGVQIIHVSLNKFTYNGVEYEAIDNSQFENVFELEEEEFHKYINKFTIEALATVKDLTDCLKRVRRYYLKAIQRANKKQSMEFAKMFSSVISQLIYQVQNIISND